MNSIPQPPVIEPPGFPIVTAVLVALNVGVWLLQVVSGVPPMNPPPATLVAWGGDLPLYTLTGDTWRLATAMFLHSGLVHVGLNMYVLAFTGPRVEYEFGRARMLGIYLAGGLLSSCASAYWGLLRSTPDNPAGLLTVSVGASGAVMALFGSMLTLLAIPAPRFAAFAALHRPHIDKSLIQVVAINLGMGFLVQGVDQAAHVGGLVGGLVVGAIMSAAPAAVGARAGLVRFLATVLLTTACVGALLHGIDRADLKSLRTQYDEYQASHR
jgi:membrane associated rhomboid family serine protease